MGASAVVDILEPDGDPTADLFTGGEGTPVVVLDCESGPKGFNHGISPAHSGLPHRHGPLVGAHVGSRLIGGELRSPISMQTTPLGMPPRMVGPISNTVITRSMRYCSPMVYPRTWRGAHCARHKGSPSLAHNAARHAIKGTLVPLAVAVSSWATCSRPPRLAGRGRACKPVRPRGVSTRRPPTAHRPHPRHRASGRTECESPIDTAQHLVCPCHRLIQTPPRHRALGTMPCTVHPRVIVCAPPKALAIKAIEKEAFCASVSSKR